MSITKDIVLIRKYEKGLSSLVLPTHYEDQSSNPSIYIKAKCGPMQACTAAEGNQDRMIDGVC